MNTLTQSAVSTQYIQVEVTALQAGAAYDPTGNAVAIAFVPDASPPPDPSGGEWNTASWETDSGPVYWAQILVGPANGGVVLAAGSYVAWVRVTASPEVPAFPGAYLIIS